MDIIFLDSLSDPRAEVFAGLTEARLRTACGGEGLFIAESVPVIGAALESGFVPEAFLCGERHIPKLLRCAEKYGSARIKDAPVFTSREETISALTGYRLHRGILAAFRRKPLAAPEEILAGASRAAVLENVTDAENVGAVFRSAAALGMDAVLVSPSCCDPLHRRAARVSMGAVFRVPWAVLPCPEANANAVDTAILRRLGFRTAALALRDDSIGICSRALAECDKLAMILGAEGNGLTDETIDSADFRVKIPMKHGMDSLNVAAAAAVAFWELCGKRS